MKMKPFDEDAHIVASTLKVIASESLDISKDLENNQNKSIAEIINEKKEEDKEGQKNE